MKTIIAILAIAGIAAARPPQSPPLPQAPPMPAAVTIQPVAAEWDLSALTVPEPQPQPAPVVHQGRPNVGTCVCGQGKCFCQPASICARGGCPQLKALRRDEVPYYFPAYDPSCPTGR